MGLGVFHEFAVVLGFRREKRTVVADIDKLARENTEASNTLVDTLSDCDSAMEGLAKAVRNGKSRGSEHGAGS